MNPTVHPLEHGVGFRLIPAPSSSMNQQLSSSSVPATTTSNTNTAVLRQKILCKNKSTAPQQTSSSGRSNGSSRGGKRGHALKFHNFVANDCHSNGSGVNTKKSDSHQPTFCLREEHGTKQITVSHWKTSSPHDGQSQDSPEEEESDVVTEVKSTERNVRKETERNGRKETERNVRKEKEKKKSSVQANDEDEKQKSILESLLATRMLNQDRISMKESLEGPPRKRSKRKPLIVRRVMLHDDSEEAKMTHNDFGSRMRSEQTRCDFQDEPLDLSTKKMEPEKKGGNRTSFPCQDCSRSLDQGGSPQTTSQYHKMKPSRQVKQLASSGSREVMRDPSIDHLIQSVEESAAHAASIMASVSGQHNHQTSMFKKCGNVSQPSNYGSDLIHDQSRGIQPPNYGSNLIHDQSRGIIHSTSSQGSAYMGQAGCIDPRQNHFNPEQLQSHNNLTDQERLLHKQSTQRNVIKQKLEDAFRTNGFLVKTKQVSDGDATFCKFRQLRKYTRYYLKSWHKHLPDEVNKLYKGFLPPSSNKSNGSGSSSTQPFQSPPE